MNKEEILYRIKECGLVAVVRAETKEEAFKIGQEIAATVTSSNPKPVKLNFEKALLYMISQL